MANTPPVSNDELRERIIRRTREEQAYHENPVYLRRERERKQDRARDILVLAALILTLIAGVVLYVKNYRFTTYSVDEEISFGDLKQTRLYAFGNGVVSLGTDSLNYIEKGTIVWSQVISLDDPVFASKGDFFALCDKNGYTFYVCDATGVLSSARVSRKIRGLDIASTGVTAVFTEGDEAAYISYFDRFGNKLSVEVKTVFTASGYPVKIALSPDGNRLLVLFYSLQNGIGESRLVLYDFENGKSSESYVEYKGEDFYESGNLLMDASFFDDTRFAAVGDQEVRFMTCTHVRKAEVTEKSLPLTDEVRSVLFSGRHVLVTRKTDEGMTASVYDTGGNETASFAVPENYSDICFSDETVVFLEDREVTYYNLSGKLRYEGELVSESLSAVLSGKSLVINTGEKLQKLTFK